MNWDYLWGGLIVLGCVAVFWFMVVRRAER